MAAIRQHAEDTYPNECCGLLIGQITDGTAKITDFIPCQNISDTPAKAFEILPTDIISWQKKLRGTNTQILGHLHSHPNHPAEPSDRDREQISDPLMIWGICSVKEGISEEVRFFLPTGRKFSFSSISFKIGNEL